MDLSYVAREYNIATTNVVATTIGFHFNRRCLQSLIELSQGLHSLTLYYDLQIMTIMNILPSCCCYSFDAVSSQITNLLRLVVEQEEEEEQSEQSCYCKDLEVDVVAIDDVAMIAVVLFVQMAIEDLMTKIMSKEQIQLGLIGLEFSIFQIVFVGEVWIRLVLLMDSLIDVKSSVQYV